MSDLFRKLRENNSRSTSDSPSSSYSFDARGAHPFRDRPGTSTTTSSSMVSPGSKKAQTKRTPEGDRPHAYQPPVKQEPGVVYEWEPPAFGEILKDLGLRILEVSIAAAAYAAGEEVAYFFRRRRFYTDEQKKRKDW